MRATLGAMRGGRTAATRAAAAAAVAPSTGTLREGLPRTHSSKCRPPGQAGLLIGLVISGLALIGPAAAQQRVTVSFDGAEAPPRSARFEFLGSRWTGGRIEADGLPGLNASGAFSYVSDGSAEVTFAQPVRALRFFYVHGFGKLQGRATAYHADGHPLGSVDSVRASFHGAPQAFVGFDTDAPVARVVFDGGIIDSFSYERADAGLTVDTSFNGAWVNSSHAPFVDGQGMLLEYIPETESLFVAWFIYDDDGGQRWLTAQGPMTGASAALEIITTSGGRLNRPEPVERGSIGMMHLSFTDCDQATVQVELPGVVGADATFEITRLRRLATSYRCGSAGVSR